MDLLTRTWVMKMMNKEINRLKVVLAEQKRTNKWLAKQI